MKFIMKKASIQSERDVYVHIFDGQECCQEEEEEGEGLGRLISA